MLTAGRSFVLTAVATILAAGACSRSDRADLLTPKSPEERAKVVFPGSRYCQVNRFVDLFSSLDTP